MKKSEKLTLSAVYDKDVKKLLINLGLLDEVNNGKISCHFCNDTVRVENFGGMIRLNKRLVMFCEKIECYKKMLAKRKKA